MSRGKSKNPPKYRLHKARNLAAVTIDGKDRYLGEYGSPESYEEYAHLIAEWRQGLQAESARTCSPRRLTIAELTLTYWEHCKDYYSRDGKPNGRTAVIRSALRAVNGSFAGLPATEFGPLKLQVVRQKLVDRKLGRRYINDLVGVIVAMFKWGVSREMVDVSVHLALKTVGGLRKGKTPAPEGKSVKPVDEQVVERTLAHAPPVIGAMVRLQLLSGARPGEIRNLRPSDVTIQADEVWCYRPEHHKTEHHDKERRIYLGPQAQTVLRPYLDRDAHAYCFSPKEAEEARRREMRRSRKTPVQPSQQRRRKSNPKRKPAEKYSKDSYGRAIKRACKAAGVAPWRPHQLRHTGATRIRHAFGIEHAQAVLGVSDLKTAEIYAERDFDKAAEIMRQVG